MAPRPRNAALWLWSGGLILFAVLAWLGGFLYWQIRIARAIGELRTNSAELLSADHPPSDFLQGAGCRAIPAIFAEFRNAVERQDRDWANLCYAMHNDCLWPDTGWNITPKNLELSYLQQVLEYDQTNWESNRRRKYPSRWIWWSGQQTR